MPKPSPMKKPKKPTPKPSLKAPETPMQRLEAIDVQLKGLKDLPNTSKSRRVQIAKLMDAHDKVIAEIRPKHAPPRPSAPKPKPNHEQVSKPRATSTPEVTAVRLENWSCTSADPHKDPREPGNLCLQGDVFGHPKIADGEHIITSSVIDFKGLQVTTMSRTYLVGKPNPEWLKWLKKEGKTFNAKDPLKFVSRTSGQPGKPPKPCNAAKGCGAPGVVEGQGRLRACLKHEHLLDS